MAWIKIASGTSPNNVRPVSDVEHLPKGTPFTMYVTTDWMPFGPLADAIWGEFFASLFDVGGDVIDVSGPSWNKVKVECVADPPLSVAGIILAVLALGVFAWMITKIEIWADIVEAVAETTMWIAVGIMAACALVLVSKIPKRRET